MAHWNFPVPPPSEGIQLKISAASQSKYATSGPESTIPDTTFGCAFRRLRAPDAHRIIMFDATRAIYTHAGRKLSHSTSTSVAEPG